MFICVSFLVRHKTFWMTLVSTYVNIQIISPFLITSTSSSCVCNKSDKEKPVIVKLVILSKRLQKTCHRKFSLITYTLTGKLMFSQFYLFYFFFDIQYFFFYSDHSTWKEFKKKSRGELVSSSTCLASWLFHSNICLLSFLPGLCVCLVFCLFPRFNFFVCLFISVLVCLLFSLPLLCVRLYLLLFAWFAFVCLSVYMSLLLSACFPLYLCCASVCICYCLLALLLCVCMLLSACFLLFVVCPLVSVIVCLLCSCVSVYIYIYIYLCYCLFDSLFTFIVCLSVSVIACLLWSCVSVCICVSLLLSACFLLYFCCVSVCICYCLLAFLFIFSFFSIKFIYKTIACVWEKIKENYKWMTLDSYLLKPAF